MGNSAETLPHLVTISKVILSSVGVDADEERLNKVLSELSGKNVEDVIAEGKEKLASVPSGGAVAAGGAAAAGDAAPAEEEKKAELLRERIRRRRHGIRTFRLILVPKSATTHTETGLITTFCILG